MLRWILSNSKLIRKGPVTMKRAGLQRVCSNYTIDHNFQSMLFMNPLGA